MTSEQVEAAVAAYLAAGDAEAVAGRRFGGLGQDCPVKAACRCAGVPMRVFSDYCQTRKGQPRIPHTPTVREFVRLVDAEPGPTVTKGRCRELWSMAKGAG